MVVSAGSVVKVVGLTAVVLSAALPHGARANEAVAVPSAVANLVYDGCAKVGVSEGAGYTLVGNVATNAGAHVATATLAPGFVWADGTDLPKAIDWTIAEPAYGRLYGWLETDGKGYILTDYVPNLARTGVRFHVHYLQSVGDNVLCSANGFSGGLTDYGKSFNVFNESDIYFQNDGLACEGVWYGDFDDIASDHVIEAFANTLTVDGVTKSVSDTPADDFASGKMVFFAIRFNNKAGYTYIKPKKIYSACVWEADGATTNAVMDLVPATDRNGAATLYDRVSNTCLKPTNGGGFTCGEALDLPVAAPVAAEGLVADGTEKVGVPEGDGYELSGTVRASAPGRYEATATLKPGYFWEGGLKEPLTIAWSIADASNEWVTPPSVSKTSWAIDEQPGAFAAGRTLVGEPTATIAKDGAAPVAFSGVLPTEPGAYVITCAAPDVEEKAVSFTVTDAVRKFDDAHTIICWGDSLTEGDDGADKITGDDRANFHDGRFAGRIVKDAYPYELSGLVPKAYNVIAQAESGMETRTILGWTGREDYRVVPAITIPGSVAEAYTFESGELVRTVSGVAEDVGDWWPSLPLREYDNEVEGTHGGSLVGTIAGVRARLTYIDEVETDGEVDRTKSWRCHIRRLSDGPAVDVPAGSAFTPEALAFGDAVQVFLMGTNDGAANYKTYVAQISNVVAQIPSGRYLVCSPHAGIIQKGSSETVGQKTLTVAEKAFAAAFGGKYLNLRLALVTNGVARAKTFGWTITSWNASGNKGLIYDGTHFNVKGNKVVASFVADKLRALGYVKDAENNPFVNEKTGESYASASEAIDAAKAGETVRVASDPGSVDLVMKGGVSVDVGAFRESISFRLPSGVDWFDLPTAPTAAGGTVYKLNLNDRAKPVIEGAGEDRPALEVKDGKVTVRIANVKGGLYYALLSAESPVPDAAWTPVGDYEFEKAEFTVDQQGDARFYKASVTDLVD